MNEFDERPLEEDFIVGPPPEELGKFCPYHDFFMENGHDFWDRLFFVSECLAPDEIGLAFDYADLRILKSVIEGDKVKAYQELLGRYSLTGGGRPTNGDYYSYTGDEIGPITLYQCLEFAAYWNINDPNLPRLNSVRHLLDFIHAYENGEDIDFETGQIIEPVNENQMQLF